MLKFYRKKQEEQPVIPAERVVQVLRMTERKKPSEGVPARERD